ncbi:MAG: NADPH-dependent oxidoreductase [Burkholderiales bacterium]|nr:MAG: NADPH-dependent oxidoreductase [Burkholderiales bacterium]
MDDADTPAALHRALLERFGETVDVPEDLDGLDELLRMATHATHRAWTDRAVEPGLVRLLAACALGAPSKSYLQQADIVDVREPGLRAEVEALVPSMPWIADAPALLVVCGNGRRFRRLFERRGLPFTNEHLDGFFNPAVDAALVLMNLIRAAEAAGLACCPISVMRDRAARLAALLHMPAHVFPIAGLCLGWPVGRRDVNPRLSLSATLHVDRFDEDRDGSRDDAAIDAFDARYVAAQSSRRAPGTGPARTWSDERAAQYAKAQREDWGDFVRAQGFDTR